MKNYLFILLLFLYSCDYKQEESKQNGDNRKAIQNVVEEEVKPNKFVVGSIYYDCGYFDEENSKFEGSVSSFLYVSSINEIGAEDLNETFEYRFMDDLEQKMRDKQEQKWKGNFKWQIKSITKREYKVFDSYREASEYSRNPKVE